LGIGDWGLPNPQSPIPNPQSPTKQTKKKPLEILLIKNIISGTSFLIKNPSLIIKNLFILMSPSFIYYFSYIIFLDFDKDEGLE